jgi:hypothetical protein
MNKFIYWLLLIISASFQAKSQSLEWILYSDSQGSNSAGDLVTDKDGNIYLPIYNQDTSYFLSDTLYSAEPNVHIYKLSPAGDKIWRKDALSLSELHIDNIAVDSNDNVCATGWTRHDIVSIDGQEFSPVDTLENAFIWKMDKDGTLIFFKFISGGTVHLTGLRTDNQQNLFVLGRFNKILFLGDTILNTAPFPSYPYPSYYMDSFIAKFDGSGDLKNLNVIKSGGYDYNSGLISEIALDANGLLSTVGTYSDSIGVDGQWIYATEHSNHMIIINLDSDCNVRWTKIGCDSSTQAGIIIHDIDVDGFGNIYISGTYFAQTGFDNVIIEPVLEDYPDAFVVKCNSEGTAIWAQTLGADKYICEGMNVEVTNSGNIFWTGYYADSALIGDTVLRTTSEDFYYTNTYVSKISKFGDIMDVFTVNSDYITDPYKMAVTRNDTLYLLGSFQTNVIVNDTVRTIQSTEYTSDFYLGKFSSLQSPSSTCLPEGITFSTQSEIENFHINYPFCEQIEGDVTISGNLIDDLSGLNTISSIGGNLIISDNTNLTSLAGLENLSSIGEALIISNNDGLISLSGIDNINSFTINDLTIINNSSLSTCEVKSICNYLANSQSNITIHDNAFGCNNKEEVISACGNKVGDNYINSVFRIYPNPANKTISISVSSVAEIDEINVYNQMGESLLHYSDVSEDVDISELENGIYILEIISEGQKVRKKLIIQE